MAQVVEDWFGKYGEGRSVEPVRRFTLTNKNKAQVQVITYGATITSIKVPDADGKIDDIVCGFDSVNDYYKSKYYFGCTVGRVANRIANGKFSLNGKNYNLACNNGPNHLHGGIKGFDKMLWSSHVEANKVKMSLTSTDMEEGYPGEVSASVSFELTDKDELIIEYFAETTKPTPINLTNHSYFNLEGQGCSIYDHELSVNADYYTPVDNTGIPIGEKVAVQGTAYDLREPVVLGKRFEELSPKLGYDDNFCINATAQGTRLRTVARLRDRKSGRVMEVESTKPGIQVYSANFLPEDDSLVGKDKKVYRKHCALCLETQNFPNAINNSSFPSCVLRAGEAYQHTTIYRFLTSLPDTTRT